MKRETLKQQIFRIFGPKLGAEGATTANTKVKLVKRPKAWRGQPLTYLGKLGRRFIALVPKAACAAFVILVCIAPLVPKETPILVPRDGHPVMVPQQSPVITVSDFAKFPPSGTYQLYVSQFGGSPPAFEPVVDSTYDITPGDHLIFQPRNILPPPNYIFMRSGSLLG